MPVNSDGDLMRCRAARPCESGWARSSPNCTTGDRSSCGRCINFPGAVGATGVALLRLALGTSHWYGPGAHGGPDAEPREVPRGSATELGTYSRQCAYAVLAE